jgi:hypothetical protein
MVEALRYLWSVFARRFLDLGRVCALFDARVIDGAVQCTGWFVRASSSFFMWWDKWVIDGVVNFAGKFTRSLSHPVRMFQGGIVSSYALFVLLGFTLLLAYYGHHMYSLVRGLH